MNLTLPVFPGLKYNTTGEYSDNDGIEMKVPDSSISIHDMVQWFVDKGYTRGKDIVGASYDWRYSPIEPLSLSLSPTPPPSSSLWKLCNNLPKLKRGQVQTIYTVIDLN